MTTGAMFSRWLRRFRRQEDGSVTIEFVILFPAFLTIFLSATEAGIMMVRNVMLERGVDIAVRSLRLGSPSPDFDQLRTAICDNAFLISDCANTVQVELQPINTTTWTGLDNNPKCIDVTSQIAPVDATTYTLGSQNQIMVVRVCALFDVFFPSTSWGIAMPEFDDGRYALVSSSIFVNEPS